MAHCGKENWILIGSLVIEYEISKIADKDKKKKVLGLTIGTSEKVGIDGKVNKRALELENAGFKTFDALHIACAEKAQVDAFLTTDDKLLNKAINQATNLNVFIANPLQWLLNTGI